MDLVALAYVHKDQTGVRTWLTYIRTKVDLVALAYVHQDQSGLSSLGLRT